MAKKRYLVINKTKEPITRAGATFHPGENQAIIPEKKIVQVRATEGLTVMSEEELKEKKLGFKTRKNPLEADGDYQCPYCGYRAKSRAGLQSHFRAREREKRSRKPIPKKCWGKERERGGAK